MGFSKNAELKIEIRSGLGTFVARRSLEYLQSKRPGGIGEGMDLTDSYLEAIPADVRARYELRETRNAAQLLASTNPEEFEQIVGVLRDFTLTPEDILTPGGSKGLVATRIDKEFRDLGWREGRHDTEVRSILTVMPYRTVGETKKRTVERIVLNEGYKVDNVKGGVALDVEWNAKDGNLDRDVGLTERCTKQASSTAP